MLFTDNENLNRRHIYTDEKGHNYYVCDFRKYSGSRRVKIQLVLDQLARGIDNTALYDLLKQASDFVLTGDKKKAIYALANIEARTLNLTNEKLLLDASLACIFLENEPDEYNPEWVKKKVKIWSKDEKARFFFMKWSMETFQELPNLSMDQFEALIRKLSSEKETMSKNLQTIT